MFWVVGGNLLGAGGMSKYLHDVSKASGYGEEIGYWSHVVERNNSTVMLHFFVLQMFTKFSSD